MVCPNCGTDHSDRQVKFCSVCGSKIEVTFTQSQPVSGQGYSAASSDNQPVTAVPKAKTSSGAQISVVAVVAITVLAMLIIGGIVLFFSMQADELFAPEPTVPETDPVVQLPMLVPDCTGMYYSEVEEFFATTGCTPVFEYVFSDEVEEGYVIEQSIPADSEIPELGEIVLTVSQGPDIAPEGYNQKVVVSAAEGSSYGTMVLYEWEDSQWVSKFTCDATVGKKGIASDYGEGRKKTPMGVFKLGVALSANSIPNDNWPYRRVTSDTCVVDDTGSVYYNTIQSVRGLPRGVSYDPIGNTLVQGYSNVCIYIEHNGDGFSTDNVIPGMGSVITICGRSSAIKPTAGCVDISATDMNTLLRLLNYDKNPHIEIIVA